MRTIHVNYNCYISYAVTWELRRFGGVEVGLGGEHVTASSCVVMRVKHGIWGAG